MPPFNDSLSRSFGTAVISFDLASVAIWPSTRRCSQPQALTMCRHDLARAVSKDRRKTLPSIAMPPWQVSAKRPMNAWKQRRNCAGSSARNTRLNVSCGKRGKSPGGQGGWGAGALTSSVKGGTGVAPGTASLAPR